MDVYGCSSWPINNSDDLAKQMLAQLALNGALQCNRGLPEGHTMPVPTTSPWNIDGMPWGLPAPQPSLVEFTGQEPQSGAPPTPIIHCKRKPVDVEPVIPAKQLITEEKMAAHLSGLHISSQYTEHALAPAEAMEVAGGGEALPSVSERLRGHTIVLSDELKGIKDEPILPASIMERLEKPCMSLVVWKPQEPAVLAEDDEDSGPAHTPTPARSGLPSLLVQELNGMDVEM